MAIPFTSMEQLLPFPTAEELLAKKQHEGVVSVTPGTTVLVALQLMAEKHIGAVLSGVARAVFRKVIELSGFSKSIVSTVIALVGRERAILSIVLVCAVLTYGGVSLFVVVFAVYPFAAEMFRQSETPRDWSPALSRSALSLSRWIRYRATLRKRRGSTSAPRIGTLVNSGPIQARA